MFPQQIDKDIAETEPVRIISSIIDKLNLENIKKLYHEYGRCAYHPQMMLKVIIYAYMNNVYSCRKIESLLKRDIHYIWLAGYNKPDFITINRFRNRVKHEINNIFTQLVLILVEKGLVSLDTEYIDGTKIESKANKYTFVWRKSVEQNRNKLLQKIKVILEQVDESIAQDKAADKTDVEFTPEQLNSICDELKKSIEDTPQPTDKSGKEKLKEKKNQLKELEQHREKLQQYNSTLERLGERNSLSKTDPDATFMRLKEDAMNNGQTKPAYNLQISSKNQFITNFALFPNPTDTLTLKPFLSLLKDRYGRMASVVVADAGYGSEENYHFMEDAGIEAFVKYNYFHLEQRPRYTPSPYLQSQLHYNAEKDFFVCPMGQRLNRIDTIQKNTENGFQIECARYRAQNCQDCPLRVDCYKGKEDCRTIDVNHRLNRYKEKARKLLLSEEGRKHRGRRCIEPEAVFGQIKSNMAYRRFRHFGLDKVNMDFAFLAIAFNLKKMCNKMAKIAKN
jgi:transposase